MTNEVTDQFGRSATLVVSKGGEGLDLSDLHFEFATNQSDNKMPGSISVKIYNMSDKTAIAVKNEFADLTLTAGYAGNTGVIFAGSIKQVRRGKDTNVDSYVEITAADGDAAFNFGLVNKTLAAGATYKDVVAAATDGMGLSQGFVNQDGATTALSRGKVMWGMAQLHLDNVARTQGWTWSIQNGKVNIQPYSAFLPNEAVVLNSQTGLIGMPEQTEGGIEATCLLNPKIIVGGLVQINQNDIIQARISQNYGYLEQGQIDKIPMFPAISSDGFYRVLVAEHLGDTRGGEWYSILTMLSVDPSAKGTPGYLPFIG